MSVASSNGKLNVEIVIGNEALACDVNSYFSNNNKIVTITVSRKWNRES